MSDAFLGLISLRAVPDWLRQHAPTNVMHLLRAVVVLTSFALCACGSDIPGRAHSSAGPVTNTNTNSACVHHDDVGAMAPLSARPQQVCLNMPATNAELERAVPSGRR